MIELTCSTVLSESVIVELLVPVLVDFLIGLGLGTLTSVSCQESK